MDLFTLVDTVFTLISADFLCVGEIQSFMLQIQSAKLTFALTEAELTQVNFFVAQFSIPVIH